MDGDDVGGGVEGPDASVEELLSQVGDVGLVAGPEHATLVRPEDLDGLQGPHLVKYCNFFKVTRFKDIITIHFVVYQLS